MQYSNYRFQQGRPHCVAYPQGESSLRGPQGGIFDLGKILPWIRTKFSPALGSCLERRGAALERVTTNADQGEFWTAP